MAVRSRQRGLTRFDRFVHATRRQQRHLQRPSGQVAVRVKFNRPPGQLLTAFEDLRTETGPGAQRGARGDVRAQRVELESGVHLGVRFLEA